MSRIDKKNAIYIFLKTIQHIKVAISSVAPPGAMLGRRKPKTELRPISVSPLGAEIQLQVLGTVFEIHLQY